VKHFQNGKRHYCKRALLATMAQRFGLVNGKFEKSTFLPIGILPWGTKHFFRQKIKIKIPPKILSENF